MGDQGGRTVKRTWWRTVLTIGAYALAIWAVGILYVAVAATS